MTALGRVVWGMEDKYDGVGCKEKGLWGWFKEESPGGKNEELAVVEKGSMEDAPDDVVEGSKTDSAVELVEATEDTLDEVELGKEDTPAEDKEGIDADVTGGIDENVLANVSM